MKSEQEIRQVIENWINNNTARADFFIIKGDMQDKIKVLIWILEDNKL